MSSHTSDRPTTSRPAVLALALAALAGTVHGAFSLYWAAGGRWLLPTLGERVVSTFDGLLGLIAVVGLVKIVAAVVPLVFVSRGGPLLRPVRVVSWIGALVLIAWGGFNTVSAQLVLTGVIPRGEGYDHPGMVGHGWLWDPLFLVWGAALLVGLVLTRGGRERWARRARPDTLGGDGRRTHGGEEA